MLREPNNYQLLLSGEDLKCVIMMSVYMYESVNWKFLNSVLPKVRFDYYR